MTADLDLSPAAVERLARPIPVSNNLQVTPAITHGYALELRPVRWLPYKPDGRRQMKQRGRWQEMNEYGGWGNCKTPNEIWPGGTAPDLISGYHAALAENARLRAERDAAWQAGAEAMREAAADRADDIAVCMLSQQRGEAAQYFGNRADMAEFIAISIRALPIPDKEGE